MSLADTFLNDLDELGSEEEDGTAEVKPTKPMDIHADGATEGRVLAGESKPDLHRPAASEASLDVLAVAKLRRSKKFRRIMSNIRGETKKEGNNTPEYDFLVEANALATEADDELASLHRFVQEAYAAKFPELESIVTLPSEYIRAVRMIKNETDVTKLPLEDILPQATVMVVSVTASTTNGTQLNLERLKACMDGCEEFDNLVDAKRETLSWVEQRMNIIAPNVCGIVGARIAAQLLGLAGGLHALASMPSCNIQVIGQEKRALAGFARSAVIPNAGIIYYSELVQGLPTYMRMKGLKNVAAKVCLAARCDAHGSDKSGAMGARLREEVVLKMEKLVDPGESSMKKAMPRPEPGPKKKRGGRRARAKRDHMAVSESRKQQNRMCFAGMNDEYSDSAMGRDMGMLGTVGSGKVRAPQKKERKKLLSQATSKRLRVANAGSGGNTGGISSSLVFTPVQGIELVNPNADAEAKVRAANAKWFERPGFVSAMPKTELTDQGISLVPPNPANNEE
eukprot:417079_1